MANQVRIGAGVTGAKEAGSELDRLRDRVEKMQKAGAKGFAIGAGAAVTAQALGLVGEGIGEVTSFLGESVRAYREQEVAAGRLTASLRANVTGWNGSTEAIRAATEAGVKLGFTDTETTNAIASLLAATHDQAKALQVLAVAQDLARFKSIPLQDAAIALTALEAGRARGLAQLGINVKDYATTEERLAAVEKVTGGQAQQYANSDLGKVAVASAKTEAAQEKLGAAMSHLSAAVLPAVADGFTAVTNAVFDAGQAEEQLAVIQDHVSTQIATGTKAQMEKTKAALEEGIAKFEELNHVGPVLAPWALLTDPSKEALQAQLDAINAALAAMPAKAAEDIAGGAKVVAKGVEDGIIRPVVGGAETARSQAVDTFRKTPAEIGKALVDGYATVQSAMQTLLDAEKHPLSRAKREAHLEGLLTGKELARGLKSSDPLVRADALTLKDAVTAELDALRRAAPGWGRRTAKAYADGLESGKGYVEGAVNALLGPAKTLMKASSPPGPQSPLHDIGTWGLRTGQEWAKGLAAGMDGTDLAAAIPAIPGSPRGGFGGGGSGGATHMHFHFPNAIGMTPGGAEQIARAIEPIITRTQQRRGLVAR